MPVVHPSADLVRFGIFELDRRSGELRKGGARVHLQEQALQVLTLLLERPGDLITRDELRQRLWPRGTFIDFEHGLNAVVNRLRDALGDSAESPLFIETLPRRGYRFVAPVQADETALPEVASAALASVTLSSTGRFSVRRPGGRVAAALALGILTVVAGALWHLRRPSTVDGSPPRLVPITRLVGVEDWPAFSPDGEQVAFSWSGEKANNVDIWVTLIGTTEVLRLTTNPADDYAPSWSPDGRRIAFLRKSGRAASIHVTSPLGGSDLKVGDFPVRYSYSSNHGGMASRISWSPDSRFVAAGLDDESAPGAPAGIFLIPVNGGEPRSITRPTRPRFDYSPAFSPDGRQLAYISCETHCDVRVVDVDVTSASGYEGRTLMRRPMALVEGVTWSRDGRSILFVGVSPGDVGLWRIPVQGNADPERVELAGGIVRHPATVASRDRLAFSRQGTEVHLYRFNATLPDELVGASSSFEGDPHFSPDGQRLAFASGRSGQFAIWVSAADGSAAQALTHGTWDWGGSPSWAPDGHTVAFDASDAPDAHFHIWTVDAEGGGMRQITNDANDQMTPTWSGDGQWIYFSARHGPELDIWRVRATGGQPEQVTHTGSGFLGYESFDGTSVLSQLKPEDSALWLRPLSGAGSRRLVACVRTDAFAPAGRVVFYVACEPGLNPSLHTIDIVSGEDRILGRLEHSPPGIPHVNLAVSPDGKAVLYKGVVLLGADLIMIENFR